MHYWERQEIIRPHKILAYPIVMQLELLVTKQEKFEWN
jgi:hypothetical protein